MNRTARVAFALAATALLASCRVADAPTEPALPDLSLPRSIKYGELAGARYPAVVLILMEEAGVPAARCSGTLIAPKLVLTAGHCTGAPGEFSGMRVFTESDVQNGSSNYPYAGPNSVEAASWKTHPSYTSAAFFLHDVGYIVLKKAITLPTNEYGTLPALNSLDGLPVGPATRFTAVGYGAQRITAAQSVAEKVRMIAEPNLLQVNTSLTGRYSLLLSNNASTGGTCFGDSGGPDFLGSTRVIAGVTSFAMNGSCAGTGGVFRLDRTDVLAFVNDALNKHGR